MSGTGKSTIIRELRRKGFTAIDMDDPGWSTWGSDGHQIWLEEPLQKALDAAQSSPTKIIAQGTDWRLLNELKKELNG
jgi:hypothetical protein